MRLFKCCCIGHLLGGRGKQWAEGGQGQQGMVRWGVVQMSCARALAGPGDLYSTREGELGFLLGSHIHTMW